MIGYVLFGGILLALVVGVVAAAVVSGKTEPPAGNPARERQDIAIEALRALEFEFQTGKLPEEEYVRLRRELELEAVRSRDEVRAGARDARDDGTGAGDGDDSGAAGSACATCGHQLTGGESFCPDCGAALR